MRKILDFSDRERCEEKIQMKWEEFRQNLANGFFKYNDMEGALRSDFLKVFNDVFQHGYYFFEKKVTDIFNADNHIVRAARIGNGMPVPSYERFIPKAEFITNENRFSPPRVEWLYLAFAPRNNTQQMNTEEICAMKECRAVEGEQFAICDFKINTEYGENVIVDLTIAKEKEFDDLNSQFEKHTQDIYTREVNKIYHSCITKGTAPKPNTEDIVPYIREWFVYTYAKLISEQLFLPIDTKNKKLMYAPFQCIAQYFLSKGYHGIIYSSTVYPEGKNIVLFNKNIAKPCGNVRSITIPACF